MRSLPVSLSFATIQGAILVDPSVEEESLATSTFTLTGDDQGNIRVFKPGGAPMAYHSLEACYQACSTRLAEVKEMMRDAVRQEDGGALLEGVA